MLIHGRCPTGDMSLNTLRSSDATEAAILWAKQFEVKP